MKEQEIKKFAEEILPVCQKYGVNIEFSDRFFIGIEQFELMVHGAWEVDQPIEVYKILPAEKL